MRHHRAHPRAVAWLLILGIALGTVVSASGAFAADEPPAKGAAEKPGEADAPDDFAMQELERRLYANPLTLLAMILVKFLPIGIGVVFLILWWLKRDKIRGGVLPPPARVEATVPVPAAQAYSFTALGMYVIPALAIVILGTAFGDAGGPTEEAAVENTGPSTAPAAEAPKGEPGPPESATEPAAVTPPEKPAKAPPLPLWIRTLAVALGVIPIAVFLLRRRFRVQAATPAERAVWFPTNPPEPTPPPSAPRAAGLGFWGYCVACVAVVPISLLWIAVLTLLDLDTNLQELVKQVMAPGAGYEPWLIVIFGVLVAPFGEEILFRGTLYPATKRAFGGNRKAAWQAALLVSFLFAAVHGNLAALLPLFALAMVLTWIMESTNSLLACMFVHALHNAFSLVPLMLLRATS